MTSKLGLKRGVVDLVNYQPEWTDAFIAEKKILGEILGDKIVAIEHIGSTSVPGLAAKPIIDMVAAVETFDDLPEITKLLQENGYEYIPERMFEDRKFFPKGPRDCRTHHLGIVLQNDPKQWQQPIMFRDYLIRHQDWRNQYASLKKELAKQYKDDRQKYTRSKIEFIELVHQKALTEA